jgi:DNA-binding transcriptional ArsR family regulator
MRPIKSINDPRYVKAMSHPIRVRIMAILDERTATPNELSKLVGATLGTTAYHVRTLERLGLLKLVKETKVRGAVQHHYRARARPFVTKAGWEAAAPIAKQAAVSSTLSVMTDYAQASAAAGGFDRGDAHLTRTLLRLDEAGFAELGKACDALVAKAEEIESRVAKRVKSDPHAEVTDVGLGLLLFEAVRLSQLPAADGTRSPARSRAGARRSTAVS